MNEFMTALEFLKIIVIPIAVYLLKTVSNMEKLLIKIEVNFETMRKYVETLENRIEKLEEKVKELEKKKN